MTTPSPDDPAPDDPASNVLTTDFAGGRGAVLWLALKTGLLTVLTLGLYRFWMKTRLRRWYWSAIRPGGHPLEYTGTPLEKLLGFLIAVVILAFYIGIVNLLLMFVSFSLFQENYAAYLVSFIGVIPLWFYAQYRARRYILARTRWRGLRFGLTPGAWGYAGRALLYWALTLVSAGILWPLMTFRLEKYKTDRTHFGTARMQQEGRWTMLYRPMVPLLIAMAIFAVGVITILAGEDATGGGIGALGMVFGIYGLVAYRVQGMALMARHKTLNGVALNLQPSTGRIMWITGFGYFLTLLVVALPATVLAVALFALQDPILLSDLTNTDMTWVAQFGAATLYILAAMVYFSIFLLWSAFGHAFVTMPTLRHYARVLSLRNPQALSNIQQRPRDAFAEAEGFAEALDVGASL